MTKTTFGGKALLLDRDDINTDEIIPAKYLTEISKEALAPHLLEDLLLDGSSLPNLSQEIEMAKTVITRKNFGCGSSREHAVWAFEVNGIALIIAESFARIFRQNMFNCGILAIELKEDEINSIFNLSGAISVEVDLAAQSLLITTDKDEPAKTFSFELGSFDKDLILAGGWLAYADKRY